MLMYKNENYEILADTLAGVYKVVNTISGITEFEDKVFPKCRIAADEWNKAVLMNQPKETSTGELIPFKPR